MDDRDPLTHAVIGVAIEVHREMGPGLLESVYQFPGQLVVELKAVDKLLPVHQAQLLTYLRLTKFHRGLLINFNVAMLKDGVKRLVL